MYWRAGSFPNKFKFWNIHALKGPPFYTETKEIFDYPIRVSGTYNEHPGLISFRMDWLDLLAVQGTLKSLLQHHSSKASILWRSALHNHLNPLKAETFLKLVAEEKVRGMWYLARLEESRIRVKLTGGRVGHIARNCRWSLNWEQSWLMTSIKMGAVVLQPIGSKFCQ